MATTVRSDISVRDLVKAVLCIIAALLVQAFVTAGIDPYIKAVLVAALFVYGVWHLLDLV